MKTYGTITLWAAYTVLLLASLTVGADILFVFLLLTWGLCLKNLLRSFETPFPDALELKVLGRNICSGLAVFTLLAGSPVTAFAIATLALSEELVRRRTITA
jgi:Flp pilus assembly protein TadB